MLVCYIVPCFLICLLYTLHHWKNVAHLCSHFSLESYKQHKTLKGFNFIIASQLLANYILADAQILSNNGKRLLAWLQLCSWFNSELYIIYAALISSASLSNTTFYHEAGLHNTPNVRLILSLQGLHNCCHSLLNRLKSNKTNYHLSWWVNSSLILLISVVMANF